MNGWAAIAIFCAALGAFWLLGPGETAGPRDWALRGLHAGTWLLLGAAAACRGEAWGAPAAWAGRFGAAAAATYAAFMAVLILT